MSFPRHGEIYRSDVERQSRGPRGQVFVRGVESRGRHPPHAPGAHRLDESPAGYSLQVALPQSLPPLHRPGSERDKVVLLVENFAANGEHSVNCLCQPRGQPYFALM
jgi:hypothetical protein